MWHSPKPPTRLHGVTFPEELNELYRHVIVGLFAECACHCGWSMLVWVLGMMPTCTDYLYEIERQVVLVVMAWQQLFRFVAVYRDLISVNKSCDYSRYVSWSSSTWLVLLMDISLGPLVQCQGLHGSHCHTLVSWHDPIFCEWGFCLPVISYSWQSVLPLNVKSTHRSHTSCLHGTKVPCISPITGVLNSWTPRHSSWLNFVWPTILRKLLDFWKICGPCLTWWI